MADDEAVPTERMILKREQVLVLPAVLDGEALQKTLKDVAQAVGMRVGDLKPREAWVPVAAGTGDKAKAIEQYAGKPGSPEAKEGVYRAPSLRSWKGGATYDRPPEPRTERTLFED